MRKLIALAAVLTVVAAPAAGAHTLSKKRAARYLQPVAEELVAAPPEGLAEAGLRLVDARVGRCERRSSHRMLCRVNFTVREANGEDTTCYLPIEVSFLSNTRVLRARTLPELWCRIPL